MHPLNYSKTSSYIAQFTACRRVAVCLLFLSPFVTVFSQSKNRFYWFTPENEKPVEILIQEYNDNHKELQKVSQNKDFESAEGTTLVSVPVQWTSDPIATSYRVIITDQAGNIVQNFTSVENSARLKLAKGKYSMKVAGISEAGLEGEFSDPVPVNADKIIARVDELKKENSMLLEREKRYLSAIEELSFQVTDGSSLPVHNHPSLTRYSYNEDQFSDKQVFPNSKYKPVSSSSQDASGKKLPDLRLGLLPFFSLRDSAIDKYDHGFGAAINMTFESVFFQWLNLYTEIAFSYYAGNTAPFESLTQNRFHFGAAYVYRPYPKIPLDLEAGLGAGFIYIGFLNSIRSTNSAGSFLQFTPQAVYSIFKNLKASAGIGVLYLFDNSQNLLFLEPRLGIHYTF